MGWFIVHFAISPLSWKILPIEYSIAKTAIFRAVDIAVLQVIILCPANVRASVADRIANHQNFRKRKLLMRSTPLKRQ